MSSVTLSEDDWDTLLRKIDAKECTPFIGAGASSGTVPLSSELAEEWANEYEFPLRDPTDLGQVAQFVAIKRRAAMFPKERLRDLLRDTPAPDFAKPFEPHSVLADLELPIYLTTNYDDFMFRALKSRGLSPSWKVCGWNELVRERSAAILDGQPDSRHPLVYHLHGHYEIPQSMVLTEEDYLEFLVRLNRDGSDSLLPSEVRMALKDSLLFVGYSLSDWNFRVLFRGLAGSLPATLGNLSIAVQLDPLTRDPVDQWLRRAQEYVEAYFTRMVIEVRVYWGDIGTFACELSERWKAFGRNGR
jgi:SIR2-like domain